MFVYTQYMRECICVESEREKSWVKLFWLICSGYWQQGWIGCFETLVVVPFLFSSLCYFTSLSYQTNKYLIHHYKFFHKTSMYTTYFTNPQFSLCPVGILPWKAHETTFVSSDIWSESHHCSHEGNAEFYIKISSLCCLYSLLLGSCCCQYLLLSLPCH